MRIALIVGMLLASTGASLAQKCATGASPDILAVKDWSVTLSKSSIGTNQADVKLTIESHATKPFRLIDASVRFEDVLGGRISAISLDRDAKADPSGTFTYSGSLLGTELERIPAMNRADVVVYTCTRAMVYQDGTKAEFK